MKGDPRATLKVEFTVYCNCGEELCAKADKWEENLIVEPCGRCLADAEERGYQRGNIESEEQ